MLENGKHGEPSSAIFARVSNFDTSSEMTVHEEPSHVTHESIWAWPTLLLAVISPPLILTLLQRPCGGPLAMHASYGVGSTLVRAPINSATISTRPEEPYEIREWS